MILKVRDLSMFYLQKTVNGIVLSKVHIPAGYHHQHEAFFHIGLFSIVFNLIVLYFCQSNFYKNDVYLSLKIVFALSNCPDLDA